MIRVGIDCGVKTGFAVAEKGVLNRVETLTITKAMDEVKALHAQHPELIVRIEDARLRKWFGSADARQAKSGAGVREGVGSVKRDCSIWEQFCKEQGIKFDLVHPAANMTKTKDEYFKKITGWVGRTSEHSRDAAMLVYGRLK
ncbi:hypothetical protein MMP64_12200 [Acinetobacter sp. ANC 5659]|uniref:hypothetical protein n=1 Tax=Acinetobacter TaxID=469 RepID=UPI001F4AA7CA|nr:MULTISPECIES: hypothetical protein [Acinetobacter]MCH7290996.1 hypothetical protein [Acinetobacter genomosp. 15BJ]MCH7318689.1 hypothetical protein [Acinetobacter higginsii]